MYIMGTPPLAGMNAPITPISSAAEETTPRRDHQKGISLSAAARGSGATAAMGAPFAGNTLKSW